MATEPDPGIQLKAKLRKGCREGCLGALAVGIMFVAGMAACFYHDTRVADRVLAKISVGMARADVEADLGEPSWVTTHVDWVAMPENERIYYPDRDVTGEVWVYRNSQWGGWWVFMEILVYFDPDGWVEEAHMWRA